MSEARIGQGRLFGAGSPATGEPAEISIGDQLLEVRTTTRTHRAPFGLLRVREVGTGDLGLEFAWDDDEGVRAVQIFDPDSLRRLRADPFLASAPQMTALRARRRRSTFGRTLGWSAIALFLLAPLLLLLVFLWQADRIARAASEQISMDDEAKLGEQAFAAMSATLDLQDEGPAYEAVRTLGARLTQVSRYSYRFHVAKSDEVNAFALPGGIIVIHSGLLEATRRPEELAGVLAHEIQHVEQRHSLQAAIKNLGLRGLWMLVAGDVSGGLLGESALELTALTFSPMLKPRLTRRDSTCWWRAASTLTAWRTSSRYWRSAMDRRRRCCRPIP